MTAMLMPSTVKTATTTTSMGKMTTTLMPGLAKATTLSSIPVRAIPVPNTNKLILAGPCIVFRTATVAEQVQALRQEKKAAAAAIATTTTTTTTNTVASSTSTTPTVKTEPQTPELLRCKRRADLAKLGFPEAKPVSVSRRNARERNRVKLVNLGFDTLREYVPNGKKNRKMSKVDTLRSAVDYIRQLQELIDEHDDKMDVSSSEEIVSEATTIANIASPVEDRLCETDGSDSPRNGLSPTKAENTTMTELSVVSNVVTTSENVIKDTLNNNNNNTFVNFNVDSNNSKVVSNISEHVDMDTMDALQQVKGVQVFNTVQQVNLNQHVNTQGLQGKPSPEHNEARVSNNRQLVNAAQQVNTVSAQQLLTSLTSMNTSAFVNHTASLITPPSSQISTTTITTASPPLPQTITLITLPIHPQTPLPISPNNTTDDVFLPDTQPRIRTIAPATSQSAVSTGTLATLTTLQGMGSLSGQGLTISQPCRRHLSFSESEPERTVQIQPRLSLPEQSASLLNNQQQQQSPPSNQQQQQQQQHISFTLLPGHNGDLSLLNSNLNANTLTLVPQTISIDQQQQQQQQQQPSNQPQQPSPQQPHFDNTLSNLTLPLNQSANAAFSLDQSTTSASLPLTDNHGYHHHHHQDQFQTLVAPSSVAMKQPQLQVDPVPSPSLSTSSSHTSESSYESYESLGSLEEDLQDISNWITELCNSQDINGHCDTDEGVDFLTYSDTDNL
ncbi:hypothetical protein ACOMHN_042926 [Nucella lapillus]